MSTRDVLEGLGGFVLTTVGVLAIGVLGLALIKGGVWISVKLLPWLSLASWIAFGAVIVFVLPLAIPKATRGFSSVVLYIASYLFGATLWMMALLLSYSIWGFLAVFVGFFLAGVGVVPVAMLATMFNGMWGQFLFLVAMLIVTFGCRAGAIGLAESID